MVQYDLVQSRGAVCVVQCVTLCEEGDSLCGPVCDLVPRGQFVWSNV